MKQADLKRVSLHPAHLVQETDDGLTLSSPLHQVDWQIVANDLGIAKGHAARMRFLRFRQQMEGIPKKPRQSNSHEEKQLGKKYLDKSGLTVGERIHTKDDEEIAQGMDGVLHTVKNEPEVKLEAILEAAAEVKQEAVEVPATNLSMDVLDLEVIDPVILGGIKKEPMLQ